MLDAAAAFSLGGLVAVIGWAALVAALFITRVRSFVWPATQIALPAFLALLYVVLIWQGRGGFTQGGFGSIAEVRTLFADDAALAAGWVHYLGLDLFVGAWIARDATVRAIPPLLVLPCLPLTLLLGPAGLLLYLVVRLPARSRRQAEQAP